MKEKRHTARKTSDQTLSLGGTPIFRVTRARILAINSGFILELFKIRRECEEEYIQYARAKRKGELRPWPKTIKSPHVRPTSLPLINPSVTTPMCTTEE